MKMRFQRTICMVLALIMVLGMFPVSAHAAEAGEIIDTAIVFTDLHTSKSNYKESNIKNIMTAFKNAGLPISSVTSGGDAFSVNEDSGKYTGDTSKITGYIHAALGDTSIPVNYVWSDHDRYASGLDNDSGFIYGAGPDGIYGNADDDNYYIYELSMADLSTNNRYNADFHSNSEITATIAKFVEDAAKLDQSKFLLVASHQPLFDRRDDNGHAMEWFTAINQVAENMDVAFTFGHNHKYDKTEDYYYAKGSTMPVTQSNLSAKNMVLNFTHLCAGYLEPTSTGSYSSSGTRVGTALAINIYADKIQYVTYNANGVYTGNYAVNEYVTRDHAVTEPELAISGVSDYFIGEDLDISVICKTGSKTEDVTAKATLTGFDMSKAGQYTLTAAYEGLTVQMPVRVWQKVFSDGEVTVEVLTHGATGMAAEMLDADSEAYQTVFGLLSSYAGYDVAMTGTTGEAVVSLPVPAGVTEPAVYLVGADGSVTGMEAVLSADGKTIRVVADTFGAFFVGQVEITEDLENTLVAGGTSYEERTVYVRVDSFVNGGKYVIVGESGINGSPIAYVNNNGSEGWEQVTVNSGSVTVNGTTYNNGYIEYNNANGIWTAATGFTLTNNGKYIGGTDANTLKGSAGEAVKVTYDAAAARLKTASGTTRYLYYSTYNSENWKWSTSSSSSTSSRNMWIYQQMTMQVAVSSPVTYTLQASDLHHVLTTNTAELDYALLADGAEADLPAGGSYTFEVKNDESGIIGSISADGTITFTKTPGVCFVKISCTWSEGTVYKYVKVIAEADPNACDHEYTAVTVAPTCTEDGYTTYTCVCGDTYTETIAALGHKYEAVVTAPTCTEGGYTTQTCANCGDSYVSDKVAALGHDYQIESKSATCTEAGFVTYTCACGDTYTETVAALGHKHEAVVTAPTCTEGGYTTYTCACGDSYVADETPALGHSYKVVTVDATCTTDGSVTKTCACGDKIVEVIPAFGHKYETVTVEPTCTAEGHTTHTCANCGDSYVTDKVAALGHKYVSVVTPVTCTTDGCTTHTCSSCGDTYVSDVVKAQGHKYETVTVAAICTEDGSVTKTCACGDKTVEIIPALGHSYETVTVAATCTTDGSVTKTCACGDKIVEVIPALGHKHEAVVTAATCTTDGYTTYTCACGDTYVSDVVKAQGHKYETVTVAATCTTDGSVTKTCACGDKTVEIIPALGHNHEAVVTAATCTEAGYTTYTCACGDSYVADEVPALGHSYHTVVTKPTETEGGYTTYTCTVCGFSYVGDHTDAKENSLVVGTDSYTEKTVYVRVDSLEPNGKYLIIGQDNVNGNPIAYVNNNGSEGVANVTINSGSVTAGGVSYNNGYIELSNSGAVWTATGDAGSGFTLSNNGRYLGGTDANTLKGSSGEAVKVLYDASAVRLKTASGTARYFYYSTYNGENWKWSTSIDSSTSSRNIWIYQEMTIRITNSTKVTYTMQAEDLTYVLNSGEARIDFALLADGDAAQLPAGAKYAFTAVNDVDGVIASIADNGTITFTGVVGSCSVKVACVMAEGTVYKYVTVTTRPDPNSCDHDFAVTTVEPTCTEDGKITRICSICDKVEEETIAALGHSYESTVTVPTCTEGGCTTHSCTVCGHSYTDGHTAALGHSYTCVESDGYLYYTCDTCGHQYSEKAAPSYERVSDISGGNRYVVTLKSGSKYYALSHANNTIAWEQVTVSSGKIVSEISEDLLWTYENSKLSYVSGGTTRYLYVEQGGWWWYTSYTLKASTSASSTVTLSGTAMKIGSRYLNYDGGSVSADSRAGNVYCFIEK